MSICQDNGCKGNHGTSDEKRLEQLGYRMHWQGNGVSVLTAPNGEVLQTFVYQRPDWWAADQHAKAQGIKGDREASRKSSGGLGETENASRGSKA